MALQRGAPRKCVIALFADKIVESAAVLLRKEMRMRAREMAN